MHEVDQYLSALAFVAASPFLLYELRVLNRRRGLCQFVLSKFTLLFNFSDELIGNHRHLL